jgi:hypothetical protein
MAAANQKTTINQPAIINRHCNQRYPRSVSRTSSNFNRMVRGNVDIPVPYLSAQSVQQFRFKKIVIG